LIPPALRFLLESGTGAVDGFILPGHVSTVLGREGYSFLETEYDVPAVISGFEPVDLLRGISELVELVSGGSPFEVRNLYKRVVREEGNRKARELIGSAFRRCRADWRGIGTIEESGLELREEYKHTDAIRKLGLERSTQVEDVRPGCICNEVILGESEPEDCPLFGEVCTPRKPFGPCMVSSEGTCRARYQYRNIR
jgi:hydrogenase expression/formation protein HypD